MAGSPRKAQELLARIDPLEADLVAVVVEDDATPSMGHLPAALAQLVKRLQTTSPIDTRRHHMSKGTP